LKESQLNNSKKSLPIICVETIDSGEKISRSPVLRLLPPRLKGKLRILLGIGRAMNDNYKDKPNKSDNNNLCPHIHYVLSMNLSTMAATIGKSNLSIMSSCASPIGIKI
jgi:hypothetical protein